MTSNSESRAESLRATRSLLTPIASLPPLHLSPPLHSIVSVTARMSDNLGLFSTLPQKLLDIIFDLIVPQNTHQIRPFPSTRPIAISDIYTTTITKPPPSKAWAHQMSLAILRETAIYLKLDGEQELRNDAAPLFPFLSHGKHICITTKGVSALHFPAHRLVAIREALATPAIARGSLTLDITGIVGAWPEHPLMSIFTECQQFQDLTLIFRFPKWDMRGFNASDPYFQDAMTPLEAKLGPWKIGQMKSGCVTSDYWVTFRPQAYLKASSKVKVGGLAGQE